jgi:hypothetical protein
MFPVMGAIFLEFKFFLNIAPVLAGCVIAPFAVTALQGYQFNHCFFCFCHKLTPQSKTLKMKSPEISLVSFALQNLK